MDSTRLGGRKAEAAVNDQRILEAARAVFLADPGAPIAAVAKRAGVGIGALYRRYESKERLLQELSLEGLRRYIAELETALADERDDEWAVFCDFVDRAIVSGGGALSRRLSGRFPVTDELREEGIRSFVLTQQVVDRARKAGVLRPDFETVDVMLIGEMIHAITMGKGTRNTELKRRYLTVFLAGLKAPGDDPLPHSAPDLQELAQRYEP